MKRKSIFLFILLLAVITLTGCGKNTTKKTTTPEDNIKIVASETSKIEYEDYSDPNGLVNMKIPKGWKVRIPKIFACSGYSFRVYNPENPDIGYMFSLAVSGFPKSEKDRAYIYKLYPAAIFGQLAAVDPHNTEGFYKVWAKNAKLANDVQLKEDFFIVTKDYELIENLGKTPLGGDVLRATYTSPDSGKKLQGLLTATVVESNIDKILGLNIEPLRSYHNIIMHAPEDELNNWSSVLDYSIGTIQFTDNFMTCFKKEQQSEVSRVQANAQIYSDISDMIMDSWNKRSASYDIISQKQSDATLGYERVYNVETGDVYRAYNGFSDNYKGSKYQTVTDDMYTKKISGYIEK